MKYIFSYAREDSAFVLELAQRLRQAGVHLWLDQLDILPGQRWDRAIENALKSCGGMIVVLSPESVASVNVMDEVNYTLEKGKRLVPVLLRPCEVPFRLLRVQHVDFTGDHDAFPLLLKALAARPATGPVEEVLPPGAGPEPVRRDLADDAPPGGGPQAMRQDPVDVGLPGGGPQPGSEIHRPQPPVHVNPATPPRLVDRKLGALLLLAGIFLFNLLETNLEALFMAGRSPAAARLSAWGDAFADASRGIESALGLASSLSFTAHDEAPMTTVVAYSASYFFLFPALCLIVAVVLARRKEVTPFRVFSLALAVDYAVSLPFFLLLPVPERWSHPDSGAMLLSDLLSSRLIDALRPMSGLDNCFPSFHVSMTAIAVLVCWRFRARLRVAALGLGATVALSTVVLGIHWLGDVLAGAAVATLSVATAAWVDARMVAASRCPATSTTTSTTESPLPKIVMPRLEPVVTP